MLCPHCGQAQTPVKDSRRAEDGGAIRRRRACESCGARFTTFERVHMRELTVVKANGARAPFDRDKLARSLTTALSKRPVGAEPVERLVSAIASHLEATGWSEIPSSYIGELAMEGLYVTDTVAYIRYASVYWDFDAPDDFAAIARSRGPADLTLAAMGRAGTAEA